VNDTEKQIEIAIVEDNEEYSDSLQSIIKYHAKFTCAGAFRSVESFRKTMDRGALKPDVVLLDIQLPGRDGLSLIPVLQQMNREIAILVITNNNSHLKTLEAIRPGVSGYIVKNCPVEDIERAIEEVYDGGSVIDPKLCRHVLHALEDKPDVKDELSERQRQILELLAAGYSKKEIADTLNISYATVAQAVSRVYKKFRVTNVAAAVAQAIRKGLI